MKATFTETKKGTWAYIRKSVRINGKSTTIPVKKLGLLSDIQKEQGCADPRQWVIDLAKKMTREEKDHNRVITLDFYPGKRMESGEIPLKNIGDLFVLPLYGRLGLPQICDSILTNCRARYDLDSILKTLVSGRILFPCSKSKTLEHSKELFVEPDIREEQVFRALSTLSSHIDRIQAQVWKNSQKIMERDTRVIFYDCTNYYFEIEDNDRDYVDQTTGEIITGLRKRGKSKENRPNPIVQMGLLMDSDGIPLSFMIFPGNESEQPSLKRIEEMVAHKFGLNEFIISTDAGLGSEDNRRYNMTEGREYITVQSLPSLPKEDQEMALDPRGWRVAFREHGLPPIDAEDPEREVFNLQEIDLGKERHTKFYKEIIVEKRLEGKDSTKRAERLIVTYSHDYALYLQSKRDQRIAAANKIVKTKQTKSRQAQQDPRRYVETQYVTKDGTKANKVLMSIDQKAIEKEQRFDGFYAYGTSLDDDAVEVLKARSLHHEIEHLFRTTKSFLDARPVYLQRQDRIKSHFLICFLAMVILKMLQKQLNMKELTIDKLIETLRNFKLGKLDRNHYKPMFGRDKLTDKLQEVFNIQIDNQILTDAQIRAIYKRVNRC